jgi:hypothetical protein
MVAIGHRSGGGRGRGRGDRGRGRGTWCARPLAAAPRSRRPMDPHPVSRWVRPTPAPTPQPPRHWLPLAVPTPAAGIPGLPRLLPPPPSGRARRGCRWPGEAGLIVPHAPPTARLGHVRPRRPPAPASASCLPPPSPTTLSRPRPWPAVSSRGPSLPCPLRREGPICGMFDGKN